MSNWVETQPYIYSPLKKLNFGNSSRKIRKSRYESFLVLSSFTGFLYFALNILSEIVDITSKSIIHSTMTVYCFEMSSF